MMAFSLLMATCRLSSVATYATSHGEATRKVTEVAEDVTPKSGSWGWMVMHRIKTHSAYLYMH